MTNEEFLEYIQNDEQFEKFLIAIDMADSRDLHTQLFKGFRFIDTPGTFNEEKETYKNDILLYYIEVGGKDTLKNLFNFYSKFPDKVNSFMRYRQHI